MEHKPIVEKLLAHYKGVHERVKKLKGIKDIQYLLDDTNTDSGICMCASEEFNVEIYHKKWVAKYGLFWGERPVDATTKREVLRCLQIRIDNLTKELELINAKTADNV